MFSMKSVPSIFYRIALAIAALALLTGHGAPKAAAAPGEPLTIASPAFANGAPIPVLYTCKGTDTAPHLLSTTLMPPAEPTSTGS
jgi:hypothetical protein